jgi:hypothetical protein
MALNTVKIGNCSVSRLIIGGNPFSGFSHLGTDRDLEMKKYFTTEQVKATLRQAEELGLNTHIGRADHHVMRILLEYWDQGGQIQWFAQTCPELGSTEQGIMNAVKGGAKACHIHGGTMDNLMANDRLDTVPALIEIIKKAGLAAGIAGHTTKVFDWAEDTKLPVDYYLCCYYNPIPREKSAEHIPGTEETYRSVDRDAMVQRIATLSKPAVHYKIMAAGRNDPAEAFAFAAKNLRPIDAVCIGVFPKDQPDMLAEDIALLEKNLGSRPG